MNDYFFKIELEAIECPYKQEGLQPNGDFGGYWCCRHQYIKKEFKNTKIRCHKGICPIKKGE